MFLSFVFEDKVILVMRMIFHNRGTLISMD